MMSEDMNAAASEDKGTGGQSSDKKKVRKKTKARTFAQNIKADLNLKEILVPGEKLVFKGKIHWGIYWKSGALLAFGLFVLLFVIFELGVIFTLAGLLSLAHAIVTRHMLLLVLTDQRILLRYGILQVDVVDIHFKNVESVELERMLPGFVLGYSNVVVTGVGNRYAIIPYVENGLKFRRKFNELIMRISNDEAELEEVMREGGDVDAGVPASEVKSKKVRKKKT